MSLEGLIIKINGDDSGYKKTLKGIEKTTDKAFKAVSAGIVGIAKASVFAADEANKAMNTISASTGATGTELGKLNTAMENIYKNGFGENMQQVADVVSNVKQVIGGTADEIERTSQNALILSDAFEIDTQNSIMAVNSMVEHLGVTADEAFNLIAQGAQQGANQNGDLIEVISEYSPAFATLGFDAETAMNILISGSQNGAFQIDKVGDAVKEFGIRTKDMSEGTNTAFETIGLKAVEMGKQFANGGEDASLAFDQVINGLSNIEDPLKRNEAGVALFGTTWEDLGEDAMLSMTSINNSVDKTTDTMGELGDTLSDGLSSDVELAKRELKLLGVELGQKLIPYVKDAIKYFRENKDVIIKYTVAVAAGVVALKGMLIINKIVKYVVTLTTATQALTAAQIALKAVKLTTAIGLATTAVGLLAGAMYASTKAQQEELDTSKVLGITYEENAEIVKEQTQAYKEANEVRVEALAGELVEIEQAKLLSDELSKLVDNNGEVTEANKGRVEFILGAVNEALGTEYKLTGEQITQNGELVKSIEDIQKSTEDLIAMKTAEAFLAAANEANVEALKKKSEAYYKMGEDAAALAETEELIAINTAKADAIRAEATAKYGEQWGLAGARAAEYSGQLLSLASENTTLTENQTLQNAALEGSKALYSGLVGQIADYQCAQEKMNSGDYQGVIDGLSGLNTAMQTTTTLAGEESDMQKETLAQQFSDQLHALDIYEIEYGLKTKGYTEEGLEEARRNATLSLAEYNKVGGAMVDGVVGGIDVNKHKSVEAVVAMANEQNAAYKNTLDINSPSKVFMKSSESIPEGAAAGVKKGTPDAVKSVKNMSLAMQLEAMPKEQYQAMIQRTKQAFRHSVYSHIPPSVLHNISVKPTTVNDANTSNPVYNIAFNQPIQTPQEFVREFQYKMSAGQLAGAR